MTSGTRKLVPRRGGHHSLLELVVIVVVAIGLALLIQAFLIKPYRIPSESMEPTLDVGQRVLVSRFNYHFSSPDRGDIVVFHPPKGADSNTCGASKPDDEPCPQPTPERDSVNFIKRIVAVPGDRLSIVNGHAIVNGKQQKDDFTRPCAPGTCNLYRDNYLNTPRPIEFMQELLTCLGRHRSPRISVCLPGEIQQEHYPDPDAGEKKVHRITLTGPGWSL